MVKAWTRAFLNLGTKYTYDSVLKSKIKMTNSWYLFFMGATILFMALHFIINRPMPFAPIGSFLLVITMFALNALGFYKISWHILTLLPVWLLLVAFNNIAPPAILIWYLIMLAIAFNLFENRLIQIFYLALALICMMTLTFMLFSDVVRPVNYSTSLPLNIFHLVSGLSIQGSLFYTLYQLEKTRKNNLRVNENKFRQIFEYNPLGIMMVKADFSEKVINQRVVDTLGYRKEEFFDKKISSYTHPEDTDNHKPYFQEMLQGKRPHAEFVKRYLTKDGRYLPTKTFVAPVFNAKGERTHNYAIYQNITKQLEQKAEIEKLVKEFQDLNLGLEQKVEERKKILEKANEELVRSNQDLEQFAYIASHDLQEPLRMIGNFVQLLKRRYSDKIDKEGQQYIDYAVEGVQRMSALIRALLEYSRVGRKEGQIRSTNFNKIVESKLYDLKGLIQLKDANIEMQPLPDAIVCEAQQMGTVFFHLIENGLKFNQSQQPSIKISCNEFDTHWQFSVKDNGIGIEPIYHNQAFEIFKRLHSREDYEGNGIGLALCQKIIQRHNGKIWIDQNMITGTRIYFTMDKQLTGKYRHD